MYRISLNLNPRYCEQNVLKKSIENPRTRDIIHKKIIEIYNEHADIIFDNLIEKSDTAIIDFFSNQWNAKKFWEEIRPKIEKGLDKISSPNYDALIDLMLEFSDSVILSSDKIEKSTEKIIKNSSKPTLSYKDSLDESLLMNFFSKILD